MWLLYPYYFIYSHHLVLDLEVNTYFKLLLDIMLRAHNLFKLPETCPLIDFSRSACGSNVVQFLVSLTVPCFYLYVYLIVVCMYRSLPTYKNHWLIFFFHCVSHICFFFIVVQV